MGWIGDMPIINNPETGTWNPFRECDFNDLVEGTESDRYLWVDWFAYFLWDWHNSTAGKGSLGLGKDFSYADFTPNDRPEVTIQFYITPSQAERLRTAVEGQKERGKMLAG